MALTVILFSIYSLILRSPLPLSTDHRGWLTACGFCSGVLGWVERSAAGGLRVHARFVPAAIPGHAVRVSSLPSFGTLSQVAISCQ
jgi:hypothetical protein